jgi:tRNA A-37 threonylcarbamoyl transferase component Bud32
MARTLGRYELLRPLARGGMADVYLARRRSAGIEKWLVVKRMRPETSGDPRFLDLFVREARLSMSLVHQNIVPVFDFGRIDEQVFLAMERVEGKDLGSSLARSASRRLPPLLAAFIAAECCQALDYAHQRKGPDGIALGIVHRDVTPRNVLLSWSGEVKLTDFGIAALAGDATSRLLGTPHYMAPEQARSEPIDPRADIYAIGLVLREAVSGARPRPGADRDAILDAARRGHLLPWPHLAAPPPPPTDLALGSGDHTAEDAPPPDPPPAALVAIIDRATAIVPANRYPDARSMLEELDSFIVAARAAHKAESPARQLAAWLGVVWEGARDDLEADAAIDANQLLSFIDDGAIDLIGTGTVRSMAATSADDVQAEVPALRPADAAVRPGRISSSNATVASGSFHTLPASTAGAEAARAGAGAAGPATRGSAKPEATSSGAAEAGPPRARRRPISPLAGVVVVGLATGLIVFAVMNRYHERPESGPPAAHTNPGTAPPSAGRPDPGQLAPTANPGTANPGTANPGTANPGTAGTPNAGRTHPGSPGRPGPGQPGPGPASPGRPSAGHVNPLAGRDGSGSAVVPGDGSARARPAGCRVRINLTPWAYYTTDEDTSRHETPSTVELTPGRHRVHVWNPELHVERDITINVPADRDAMNYSEPLQSASPPGVPAASP